MSTTTDELAHLDVDLDETVPCSVVDCDHDADWALYLHDCRHTLPTCTACRDYLSQIAGLIDGPFITHKPACPAHNYHWTWRPL
ncbi:hypothetical protein [Xylanimonas protaetiae]|uniref:Uncharacterized protein n=1 Tax=Xylanimonas protaetiae TaxID=2509457 RepID=A0A4P6F2H8_9MICO|nr:hypothetical protein [Xylanimonas protaetiae]QAY70040.1 hypothetical protein ET471_08325 [Xylanimonas protaetiae]